MTVAADAFWQRWLGDTPVSVVLTDGYDNLRLKVSILWWEWGKREGPLNSEEISEALWQEALVKTRELIEEGVRCCIKRRLHGGSL